MTGATAIYSLYRAIGWLATPLIRRRLRQRLAAGKEDPLRHTERLGHASVVRPAGRLLWLHAASVGEALSVLPLVDALRDRHPGLHILFTSVTVTSARLLADRLPRDVAHQFAPVDIAPVLARFLDHWRPDAAVFVESELWPVTLLELDRRGIPRALVNGRMSERSFRRWMRLRSLVAPLLAGFQPCLAQSPEDLAHFQALGAPLAACPGNLKFATPPLAVDPQALAAAEAAIGNRPRWVAASTHPGEEILVGEVHAVLAAALPELLTVIVPRHAERGPAIAAELAARGWPVGLRSRGDRLGHHALYVADTMGELGLWYRLCPVTFIGKTLAGDGGQNPMEPIQLGSAVIHGPSMSNFRRIARDLSAAGGAVAVADAAGLRHALERLLNEPASRQGVAEAGMAVLRAGAGALPATVAALEPLVSLGQAPPVLDNRQSRRR